MVFLSFFNTMTNTVQIDYKWEKHRWSDWDSNLGQQNGMQTNLLSYGGPLVLLLFSTICGQSYKQFTVVNYDSRVIPDLKIPQITTLES